MSATAIIIITAVVFRDYFTGGSVCLPKLLSTLLPTVPPQHPRSISLRLQEALRERAACAVPAQTRLLVSHTRSAPSHGPQSPNRPLGVKAWS